MLRLLINGQSVDLSTDAVVSIDEESPVFEKDSIPGGFSFPFALPATPLNRRTLGFPDRVTRAEAGSGEYPFQLFSRGRLVNSGTLSVTECDTDYRVHLMVGSGDLASRIGEKTLRSLSLGGLRHFVLKPEYRYPEDDFALFPVYNPSLMDETRFEASWAGNYWRLNSYENGSFYTSELATFAITPYPFLAYVIRQIFQESGFEVGESVFDSDPELRRLVLYSTRDIIQPQPVTEWREITFQTVKGMMTRQVPVTRYQRVLDEFHLSECLPEVPIREFLVSLRNLFNIAFVVTGSSVSIVKRQQLLESRPVVDITRMTLKDPAVITVKPTNGIKLEWSHETGDRNFSEGFNSIDDKLDLLGEPVADMDALLALVPSINEIRLVESYDAYYQYAEQENPEAGETEYLWKEFSNSLQNLTIGEGEEVFSGKISTLLMVKLTRLAGGPEIRIPWADQKSSSSFRAVQEPFTARLLFYRGMQGDSQGWQYPLGSSDNLDFQGNPIPGATLCLRWQGACGLYKQLWELYLWWWNRRRQINYTILRPDTLRFDKVYSIQGVHLILKKRSIRYTIHGIEPSLCEFYVI